MSFTVKDRALEKNVAMETTTFVMEAMMVSKPVFMEINIFSNPVLIEIMTFVMAWITA